MEIRNLEFTGLPDGEVEVRPTEAKPFTLTPENTEFVEEFLNMLRLRRPHALDALRKRYSKSKENKQYYNFLVCRGFIKCNFIVHDNRLDIDDKGTINTEFVMCPRLGECPEYGVVCNSQECSELSSREIEILRLITLGYENTEIGDILYISPNTVHNHRNNILRKLNLNNTAELVRYWFENKLDQ